MMIQWHDRDALRRQFANAEPFPFVKIDNLIEDRKLHRRLNLLLYLNPVWEEAWGGQIQLWDKKVKHCRQMFAPMLNRCVIFETNDISYHGVVPVTNAAPYPRISFATYYYTREAPANWDGKVHSTIFKSSTRGAASRLGLHASRNGTATPSR